jgi:hypothetical protein
MIPHALEAPSSALLARLTGALLLVMALAAGLAELGVHQALVVPGDAAATAGRIAAGGLRFRLGLLGYLVAFLCDVPVAVLLYLLLRHASAPLALTAAAFRLVYAAVAGASLLPFLAPVLLSSGAGYLSALAPPQIQALTLLSVEAFESGFGLALVFFGVHLVLLGVIVLGSTALPRVLGVLVAIAGISYLAGSLSRLLAPELHAAIAPLLAACGCLELVLALWLLVKGGQWDCRPAHEAAPRAAA